MSFSLKNTIWSLFGLPEGKQDTYKVGGKGINQRYQEILGEDFDEYLLPLIENIVQNTVSPSLMQEKFIPYWESIYDTPVLLSDFVTRRKILAYSISFNKVKGTKLGYRMLFNMVGIECEVQELFDFSSFDQGLGFDNNQRRFDNSEFVTFVGEYRLLLNGTGPLTQEIEDMIAIIVLANEPIDARLRNYVYTSNNAPNLNFSIQGNSMYIPLI